jgi:hypothetical protein
MLAGLQTVGMPEIIVVGAINDIGIDFPNFLTIQIDR